MVIMLRKNTPLVFILLFVLLSSCNNYKNDNISQAISSHGIENTTMFDNTENDSEVTNINGNSEEANYDMLRIYEIKSVEYNNKEIL
jgi:hypothetical protein